jgi:hypothetical protein
MSFLRVFTVIASFLLAAAKLGLLRRKAVPMNWRLGRATDLAGKTLRYNGQTLGGANSRRRAQLDILQPFIKLRCWLLLGASFFSV